MAHLDWTLPEFGSGGRRVGADGLDSGVAFDDLDELIEDLLGLGDDEGDNVGDAVGAGVGHRVGLVDPDTIGLEFRNPCHDAVQVFFVCLDQDRTFDCHDLSLPGTLPWQRNTPR